MSSARCRPEHSNFCFLPSSLATVAQARSLGEALLRQIEKLSCELFLTQKDFKIPLRPKYCLHSSMRGQFVTFLLLEEFLSFLLK